MTRREWGRRAIHIALGGGAFLVPWLGWKWLFALALAAVVTNAILLPRLGLTRWLLRSSTATPHRGLVLYPLAIAILAVVFRERELPIQLGWLAMAVGDGLAPIFGLIFKRPQWPWRREKTISASLLAFVVAFLAMLSCAPAGVAGPAAAAGFGADGLPRPFEDNLAVPLFAAFATECFLSGGVL